MSNLSGRGQLTGIIRNGGGGGGGSTVVINPTGEATGTMKKISVDGDIYEVRNVPETTGAELGSVLTHTASGEGWLPVPKEIPETTGAELGSVLTHTASGEAWLPVPSELPPVASGDNGDVLTINNGSLTWAPVIGGGGSIEYSTDEEEIGTWIDGNKIYRKVIALSSQISIPSYNWLTNAFSINNISSIIECRTVNDSGTLYYLNAYISNNNVNLLACRDGNPATARYIIIEYTRGV